MPADLQMIVRTNQHLQICTEHTIYKSSQYTLSYRHEIMPHKTHYKTDRSVSRNGAKRGVKKNGAGKNNWGTHMDNYGPVAMDVNDPNYDSENE